MTESWLEPTSSQFLVLALSHPALCDGTLFYICFSIAPLAVNNSIWTLVWVKHHWEVKFVVICFILWNIFQSQREMNSLLSTYLEYSNHSLSTNMSNQGWTGPLKKHPRMSQLGELSRIIYLLFYVFRWKSPERSRVISHLAQALSFKKTYKKSSIPIPHPVIFLIH